MLIHGHASFIGLAPIMAVTSGFFFWVVRRFNLWDANALPGSQRAPRLVFDIAAFIVAAFALPILANTVLHYPGEIPKYFRFAGTLSVADLGAKLIYFLYVLGAAAIAIPLCFAAIPKGEGGQIKLAVLALLAASVPAAAFYVVRGLDTLEHRYPLYWFCAFAAGASSIALVGVVEQLRVRLHRAIAYAGATLVSVAVIAMNGLVVDISQPGDDARAVVATLHATTANGGFVWLDVDQSDFEVIFDAATLASVDKRQTRRSFCIMSSSWSWMYPPALACDATKTPMAARAVLVPRANSAAAEDKFAHSALVMRPTTSMHIGDLETFGVDATPRAIYAEGWSKAEPSGRWSEGKRAVILIPSAELPARFSVRLDFNALVTPKHPSQAFSFVDGKGRILNESKLSLERPGASVTLPLQKDHPSSAFTSLQVTIESPASPESLGLNADTRELGLMLTHLSILPAQ